MDMRVVGTTLVLVPGLSLVTMVFQNELSLLGAAVMVCLMVAGLLLYRFGDGGRRGMGGGVAAELVAPGVEQASVDTTSTAVGLVND